MMELVGGIISIIIGVIMLIIGGSVLNTITTGSSIGNCDTQDYNGDGLNPSMTLAEMTAVDSAVTTADHRTAKILLDSNTAAYQQCNSTKNNAYTILNIISVMMIIAGVIISVRGFTSGDM